MTKKNNGITIKHQYRKGEKVDILKAFEVSNFKFYPCNYSVSKKQGYVYYLLCRDLFGCLKCEKQSPRFSSKEEASHFVLNNRDFSIRPV